MPIDPLMTKTLVSFLSASAGVDTSTKDSLRDTISKCYGAIERYQVITHLQPGRYSIVDRNNPEEILGSVDWSHGVSQHKVINR